MSSIIGYHMRLSLIVATANNRVIGRDNKMPWHLPNDLKYFKRVTVGKTVIMGRKTYDSIGRPLPDRSNIVVTRQMDWQPDGVIVVHSLAEGIDHAESLLRGDEEVIVMGGAQIYRAALPQAQRLYLTEIHADFDGDTFFPEISRDEWKEVGREKHFADSANPYDYTFIVLDRVTKSAS